MLRNLKIHTNLNNERYFNGKWKLKYDLTPLDSNIFLQNNGTLVWNEIKFIVF